MGSGNIIGKHAIQEFFEHSIVSSLIKGSILDETNCYEDAITMLILKLERKFVHLHPMLQKIFLGLPSIDNPEIKKISTNILMHEFDYIVREAKDIFAFYGIKSEHPPIEVILHNRDALRRMESNDYQRFDENMRRNVLPKELTQSLFLHTCDKFEWIAKGINEGFSNDWHENIIREPISDEVHALYEDPYDENDVSDDFINYVEHLGYSTSFEKGE